MTKEVTVNAIPVVQFSVGQSAELHLHLHLISSKVTSVLNTFFSSLKSLVISREHRKENASSISSPKQSSNWFCLNNLPYRYFTPSRPKKRVK